MQYSYVISKFYSLSITFGTCVLFLVIGIYYNLAFSGIELSWWIVNSLDRVLFSISGLFIISLVLTLDNLKNYNLK